MKRLFRSLIISLFLTVFSGVSVRGLDLDMARFATLKKAQVVELAGTLTNKVPSYVWSYFDAVRVDDWETATNLSARILNASGRYARSDSEAIPPALQTVIWPPISEAIGSYEQFHELDNQSLHWFGSNVITSLPKDCIYFGGTDPGRFIICALKESEFTDRPFFALTQNQLVDTSYLDYLRRIYGGKIFIPTADDFQAAFSDYLTNALKRLKSGKLKPGENVWVAEDGKLHADGAVSVMEVNGLLAKIIFEKILNARFTSKKVSRWIGCILIYRPTASSWNCTTNLYWNCATRHCN